MASYISNHTGEEIDSSVVKLLSSSEVAELVGDTHSAAYIGEQSIAFLNGGDFDDLYVTATTEKFVLITLHISESENLQFIYGTTNYLSGLFIRTVNRSTHVATKWYTPGNNSFISVYDSNSSTTINNNVNNIPANTYVYIQLSQGHSVLNLPTGNNAIYGAIQSYSKFNSMNAGSQQELTIIDPSAKTIESIYRRVYIGGSWGSWQKIYEYNNQ